MQPWVYLLVAILLEVAGTTSMKLSAGFTRLLPSMAIFIFYALSFATLTLALKSIEISVAYAVWSGIGMVLITAIGYFWFHEELTVLKAFNIALIIVGVLGLNLSGAGR